MYVNVRGMFYGMYMQTCMYIYICKCFYVCVYHIVSCFNISYMTFSFFVCPCFCQCSINPESQHQPRKPQFSLGSLLFRSWPCVFGVRDWVFGGTGVHGFCLGGNGFGKTPPKFNSEFSPPKMMVGR